MFRVSYLQTNTFGAMTVVGQWNSKSWTLEEINWTTRVICYIAMENEAFIDDVPIIPWWIFPWQTLSHNQMVPIILLPLHWFLWNNWITGELMKIQVRWFRSKRLTGWLNRQISKDSLQKPKKRETRWNQSYVRYSWIFSISCLWRKNQVYSMLWTTEHY